MALGGYIALNDSKEPWSSFLESSGGLDDINGHLSSIVYSPKVGFTSAKYADTIFVVISDLEVGPDSPEHKTTVHIKVEVTDANDPPTIIAPFYWEMAIHGLAVQYVDPSAIFALDVIASAESAALKLTKDATNFGVTAKSDGRQLSLTGSASNLSFALRNMIYVREPAFDGSDTIQATLMADAGDTMSTTSMLIDVNRASRTEFEVYSVYPLRGPSFGGTSILLRVSNGSLPAEPGPFYCQFGAAAYVPASVGQSPAPDDLEYTCVAPAYEKSLTNIYVPIQLTNRVDLWSTAMFFLYESLTKVELFPKFGPTAGGTVVRVSASASMLPSNRLTCSIVDDAKNVTIVRAEEVNASTALCIMPAVLNPPRSAYSVSVSLSVNGHDLSSESAEFVYIPASPHIISLGSSSGPAQGGTRMVFSGFFLPSIPYLCRFCGASNATVDCNLAHGAVQSRSTLMCMTPARRSDHARTQNVDISLDYGSTFVPVSNFTYWPNISLASSSPGSGPQSGGTDVFIRGSGFPSQEGVIHCSFGDSKLIVASIVSTDEIRCTSPSHNVGRTAITLRVDDATVPGSMVPLIFEYLPDIFLENLEPSFGTVHGGTPVLVTGRNFPPTLHLACRFGDVETSSWWINASLIECESPLHADTNSIELAVTVTGSWLSVNTLTFSYHEPVRIDTQHPSSGPTMGGTMITILGSNFVFSPLLRCRFGWTESPASYISPEEIRCVLPAHEASHVSVSISLNRHDYVVSPITFTYEAPLTIVDFLPALGPTVGGTAVVLTTSGELSATWAPVSCKFGGMDGRFVSQLSPTKVQCLSPPHEAEAVHVSVSTSGEDRYVSVSPFLFVQAANVLALTPQSGPVRGGVAVRVRGLNFVDTTQLLCRFGRNEVVGRFVETSVVECVTPHGKPSEVAVEVSVNGVDFTMDGVHFLYHTEPTVKAIAPLTGPTSGGTEVRFMVSGLRYSPDFSCGFGLVRMAASLWDVNEVRCLSPPRSEGRVDLALVEDGRLVSNGSSFFEYLEPARISRLAPMHGSSAGGTVVTIHGEGFARATSSASCVFGEVTQNAQILSPTIIQCVTPAHAQGRIELVVRFHVETLATSTKLFFEFVPPPRVFSLHPRYGLVAGGTEVTVTGANFVRSVDLCCRFGRSGVSFARWIGATQVLCESPPGVAGSASVEVSLNNQEFTTDASPIHVRRHCRCLRNRADFRPNSWGY